MKIVFDSEGKFITHFNDRTFFKITEEHTVVEVSDDFEIYGFLLTYKNGQIIKIAEDVDAIKDEYEKLKYIDKRRESYPAIEEQLDKIYHEGIDAWKAEIKAIKDLYPKPAGI